MNRFAALDIDEFEPDKHKHTEDEARFLESVTKYDVRTAREILRSGTQYVISHAPPHVWRRKDGSTLFVEAMDDTHLLNSARLLMRKLEVERPQQQVRFSLKVLMLEANHRGRLL